MTYLDTSPDYGSEPHVGAVMRECRGEVFLATEINRCSRQGVLDEVRESLERLQTDHVDLIQVHAVNAWADLEQVLAPDGAVAGLVEARDQGLVRSIGIAGHARTELLGQAIERYPFVPCWSRWAWRTGWWPARRPASFLGRSSAMWA